MAPKRPVEVLVLDSDDEEPSLRTSRPRAGSLAAPSTAATDGIGGAADIGDQFKRDLAEATRLSLEQSRAPSTTAASGSTSAGAPAGTTAPVPAVPNAGSSRAELERARLERQRAREANGTAQPSVISASIASRATGRSPTPRKRVATLADLPTDEGSSRAGSAQNGPSPLASSSKTSQRFWDGAVKRVPNDYVPDDESFSFADLVGPRQSLETAVVSAFCLDPLWVAAHFPEETPLLLVMPRTTGDTFPDFAPIGVKRNTFRVVPPTRLEQGAGVMHTKLMVSSTLSRRSPDIQANVSLAECSSISTTTFFASSFPRPMPSLTTGRSLITPFTSMTSRFLPSMPDLLRLAEKSSADLTRSRTIRLTRNSAVRSSKFASVSARFILLYLDLLLMIKTMRQSSESARCSSRVQRCTTLLAARRSD